MRGAAEAARRAEPSAALIAEWEARAEDIAVRLGILEAAAWRSELALFEPPVPLPPFEVPDTTWIADILERAIGEKGHVLRVDGGWVRCARCRRRPAGRSRPSVVVVGRRQHHVSNRGPAGYRTHALSA